MVIQVYAPTSNAQKAEVEWFYEDLQGLLELTPKQDVLFIIGDWDARVGSQETPGVTGKSGLGAWNEAGKRLIVLLGEHTGHSKYPLPTTQEKTLHTDITKLLPLPCLALPAEISVQRRPCRMLSLHSCVFLLDCGSPSAVSHLQHNHEQ